MLDLSKTVLYEVYYWYDEVKAKYDENVKMFYVDTDSFIIQVKIDDIQKKINNRRLEEQKITIEDLTLQILKQTDHYLKENQVKSNWINER